MLGSSNSIACANIMLNAAVAESLKQFADKLESASDFETALHDLIKETIHKHKRIIFNGNGYDDEWVKTATEERGLLNMRTTPDCMPHLLDKKNVDMLTSHGIFSEVELKSRCEIMLENYCKTVRIEAHTMTDMARKELLPAIGSYVSDTASAAAAKTTFDSTLGCRYEKNLIAKLSGLLDLIADRTDKLDYALIHVNSAEGVEEESYYIRDEILPKMTELRLAVDEAETLTAEKYWPFPTYGDLLFGVR